MDEITQNTNTTEMQQEEQTTPQEKPKRRPTVPLWALAAVIILAGVIAYGIIAMFSRTPFDPAAYIPNDVAFMVTVDVTPTPEKQAAIRYIQRSFESAGVKSEQEIFTKLNELLEVDVAKDVLPHLNGQGAFAVLTEFSGAIPSMVGVIGTRKDENADSVMRLIGKKLNEKNVAFSREKYNEYYYYRIPQDRFAVYVGAVKNALILAESASSWKRSVDAFEKGENILLNQHFTTMRETGGGNFASTYFSGEGYYKLVGSLMAISFAEMGPDAAEYMKRSIENNIAAVGNASASGDGIRFRMRGITKTAFPAVKKVNPDELVAQAPGDAAIVYAMTGVDKHWRYFKSEFLANPTMKDQVDQVVQQIEMNLGVNPMRDLLDRVTSFGFCYVPQTMKDENDFPGYAALVLTVDMPDVVRDTVDKVNGLALMFGAAQGAKQIKIAGQDALFLPFEVDGPVLTDVVVGDKLFIGFSGDGSTAGIEKMADPKKNTKSVTTSDAYNRVRKHMPSLVSAFLYVDANSIFDSVKSQIPATAKDDMKMADVLFDRFGVAGVAYEMADTEYQMQAVMPFGK